MHEHLVSLKNRFPDSELGKAEILSWDGRDYRYRPPVRRCWRMTSGSGRPRKTSEGRYRRSSPHKGHSTATDWKGNSSRPDGTSRWHRLRVTTNCLRSTIGNPRAIVTV